MFLSLTCIALLTLHLHMRYLYLLNPIKYTNNINNHHIRDPNLLTFFYSTISTSYSFYPINIPYPSFNYLAIFITIILLTLSLTLGYSLP